jgi:hypothetical protein
MSPYRRHTPGPAVPALNRLTTALETYRSESQRIADQLAIAVCDCINAGATWSEVGQRLEITKQAARAHWGPYLTRAAQSEEVGQPGISYTPSSDFDDKARHD